MAKDDLFCNELRNELAKKTVSGWAVCGAPLEMEKTIDYTTLRGGASNIYHSLVFIVPKWDYTMKKVNEWMEVTPEFEYYKLTVEQKQQLQATIRDGLARAAESVKDYELLAHDAERYREMIDYFLAGKKDEHVLRTLFVDRVDAFTGEGYSLVTMARRWPTIISDFIRMKTAWTDPEKVKPEEQIAMIRKELDVSAAEATVLKTKNELYREWKKLFFPLVKERYARIQNLAEARKKSIEEYRKWLVPYVARYKSMKEKLEEDSSAFMDDPYVTPALGLAQAHTFIELWLWKPARQQEMRKPEWKPHEKKNHGFVVDPYDDYVKAKKREIEDVYGVEITDAEVEKMMQKNLKKDTVYYWLIDIKIDFNLIKAPQPKGTELDNPIFYVKPWTMSQNILLIHLIELKAREKRFEKEIDELIGADSVEKRIAKRVEEEFAEKKEEKKGVLSGMKSSRKRWKERWAPRRLWLNENLIPYFVRRGPYTPVFRERLTKHFASSIAPYYDQVISFIQKEMGYG